LPRSERARLSFSSKRTPYAVDTYVQEGEDLVSRVAGVKALSDEELKQRNQDYDGQVQQTLIDKASEITQDKFWKTSRKRFKIYKFSKTRFKRAFCKYGNDERARPWL